MEYIFYTGEGLCSSPNNKDMENYQILGFDEGPDAETTLKTFLEDNEWVKACGYKKSKIKVSAVLEEEEVKDLKKWIRILEASNGSELITHEIKKILGL